VEDSDFVTLTNVVKRFGKIMALRGLSLKVPKGVIFGLIGPNGAGKTTTLRIISTLVTPDSGVVKVLGHELPHEKYIVRGKLAYLPEEAGLYERLTGWENLLYFAMIYFGRKKAEEVAKKGAFISGLKSEDLHRRAGEYSKGMARRLAIARTLMLDADLIILDEPTSGLDVFSSYRIRMMLRKYVKNSDKTIILSSHNMLEVEEICDYVGLINKGVIVASGTPSMLKAVYHGRTLEDVFISIVGLNEG
jgi:ABC-2 type transport system ATP-binding protein